MEWLKLILCGAVIGVANIIPGVSGGTLAVVLNLYDRMIEAISGITKHFVKSIKVLIPVAIGAGAGILSLARVIDFLLEKQYMTVNFFFIGVVIGSVPLMWGKMTKTPEGKKITLRAGYVVSGLITFLLMTAMAVGMLLVGEGSGDVTITALSAPNFFLLFFALVLASVSMIIPGISGSFVMVLLGVYPSIINALSNLNIPLLIPAALGALTGILGGAKLINLILSRFPQHSYFAIMGFLLGSIPVLLCKIGQAGQYRGGITILIAAAALIFGAALSYFGAKLGEKKA